MGGVGSYKRKILKCTGSGLGAHRSLRGPGDRSRDRDALMLGRLAWESVEMPLKIK